ncbi:hypothetical protein H4R33_005789 [Dimargaris cristalligena]|nr:hypothetical protein H4R33_005789 [Dimargaris cristalligena]
MRPATSSHTPLTLIPAAPKPNPAAERSRYSCLGCRKRKVRCDRLLPRCHTCQLWNSDCRYQLTPARLRKALARLPGNNSPSSASDDSTPEASSLSPTSVPLSQPVPCDDAVDTHWETPAPTDEDVSPLDPRQAVDLPPAAYIDSARDQLGSDGPVYIPVDSLLDFSANALDFLDFDFDYSVSPGAVLDSSSSTAISPSSTLVPPEWNLLPNWLVAGMKQLNVNSPAEDTLTQRTARSIFKLIGNSTTSSSPSDSYFSRPSSMVNLAAKDHRPEKNDIPWYARLSDFSGDSSSFRSLFSPVDLLFHSSVVRHSMDDFYSLMYRDSNPLHRHRILYRLDNQLVPEAYQLAAMMTVAPFSNHPAFEHLLPHMINGEYHSRLIAMLPHCLADPNPDMHSVLGMLAEATLSLGLLSLHQSILAASIRKQHGIRSYLIDHPNPPPRPICLNTGPDITVDVPTLRNEYLRVYYRTSWWAHFAKDMVAALIFGQKPLIDMDTCYVNLPYYDRDIETHLEAELANPESDVFSGKDYPTMVKDSQIKNTGVIVNAEISIIGHRIAQLRARQARDPAAWLQALPRLNKELEQWYNRFTELSEKDWRDSPYTSALPSQSEAESFCNRVRVMCSMLAIYLNHFDGHSPDNATDSYPGAALNQALSAAGDSMGRTLAECHERCWLYIVRLRELMIQSFTPPAFINNSMFTSALYPAAIVCSERIHGMGSAYPGPVDPADQKLATLFIDEIIQVLSGIGRLWNVNLTLVEEIQNIRDAPFSRRNLGLAHLL